MTSEPLAHLIANAERLATLDAGARRLALRRLLVDAGDVAGLSHAVARLSDAIDGFGPITDHMRDERVTDVLINGPDDVWVERDGALIRTPVSFGDRDRLHSFIERWVGDAGHRVDASKPVADARLADGSRLHVVLPPVADAGPVVSIRKFPERRFRIDDLIAFGMLDDAHARELLACVAARSNVLVSGRTGTGKTTLMNALLGAVPASERVVTIEETRELAPPCVHAIALVAREANAEGAGGVDMTALLRAALRMRPDRIVVGEVRGPEALVAIDALSTGHDGSILTVHARSSTDALDRLVALALRSDGAPPEPVLRARAHAVFDVVVHLDRRAGRRVVADIASP